MKKVVSFVLSIVMIICSVVCVDLSAYAIDASDEAEIIDLEIFKAQCISGIADDSKTNAVEECNNLYNYYTRDEIFSPTQSFLDSCYEDADLMLDYNEFMALKTISDPGSFLNMPKEKEDYYKTLIMASIQQTLSNEDYKIEKIIKNKTLKNSTSVLKDVCKELNIASMADLAERFNLNDSDDVKKFTDIVGKNATVYYNSKVASKAIGNVGKFISYSKDVFDLSDRICSYISMADLDEQANAWLKQMESACSSKTDPMLVIAISDLINCGTGFADAFLEAIDEVGFTVMKWSVNSAIDMGISALAGSNPVLLAAVAGLKAGRALSNLFFDGDSVASQLFTMQCVYKIEELARIVTENSKNNFISNQTNDNAKLFNYAVDQYYEILINVDTDCIEKFLDTLYNGGILKGAIVWLYGATNDYQDCINSLEGLRNTRKENYRKMIDFCLFALKYYYADTYDYYFGDEENSVVEIEKIGFNIYKIKPPGYPSNDGADFYEGEFCNADVWFEPSNTTQTSYTLKSSNTDVLEIKENCMFSAKSTGTSTVTITSNDNPRISYTRDVVVGEKFNNLDETQANSKFKYIIEDDFVTITGLADNYKPEHLILPETIGSYFVKSVGDYAFMGTSFLKTVSFSKNIVNIGDCAFYNCASLENVTSTENIETIGIKAFFNCKSLSNINLPNLKEVGKATFANCESLASFDISNSLETLPDNLFFNCDKLIRVIIPESVITVGNGVFGNCDSLKLTIAEGEYVENCALPINIIGLGHNYLYGNHRVNSITISDNLKTIGMQFGYYSSINHIFYTGTKEKWNSINIWNDNQSLDKAYNNGNLHFDTNYENNTYIGEYVAPVCDSDGYEKIFCSICDKLIGTNTIPALEHNFVNGYCVECGLDECLEYEIIENTIKITKYNGNKSIYEIPNEICGKKVTCIGKSAFSNCTNLESVIIPEGVESIYESAYAGCHRLKSIELPNSLSILGSNAFYDCKSLKSIVIPDNVKSIPQGVFLNCSSLEELKLPYVGGSQKNNTYIGYIFGADSYNKNNTFVPSSLKKIILSDSCEQIPNYAFYACSGLTCVEISNNVKSLGNYAFSGCSNLIDITIPQGINSIGNSTFFECKNLSSIVVPQGVSSIGDSAFKGCSNLTIVTIPDSVISIGNYAFSDCSNLNTTKYTGTVDQWANIDFGYYVSYWPCTSNPICYSKNLYINDNLITELNFKDAEVIKDFAFFNLESVKSIIFGDKVKNIGFKAFSNCNSLENVNFGKGLTNITNLAFSCCNSIENVIIPDNISEIGSAFSDCANLKSVALPIGLLSIDDGAFRGCSNLTNINIPNTVTNLGESAFRYCETLRSIEIPDGITEIKAYTFADCENLNSITLHSSCATIGDNAFLNCEKIREIHYDGSVNDWCNIEYYGYGSYMNYDNCDLYINENSLTVLSISDIPEIKTYTFRGVNLVEVNISGSVKYIGTSAFENCKKLKKICLEEGIVEIGNRAFSGCGDDFYYTDDIIKEVIIPDSVEIVGDTAFSGTDILNLTIGKNVKKLGEQAFCGCTSSLKNIVIRCINPELGSSLFDYWPYRTVDVFYAGTEKQYKESGLYYSIDDCFGKTVVHYDTDKNDYVLKSKTDATCVKQGEVVYYCSHGFVKSESIKAFGHNEELIERIEPTCNAVGYTKYICTICGYCHIEDKSDKLSHYGQLNRVVNPVDCQTPGYSVYECQLCGEVYYDNYVYIDHQYEVTVIEPSCTECGYTKYECNNCNDSFCVNFIKATGHNMSNGACLICNTNISSILASGSCGDNVNWELNNEGLLKIYGTGDMQDFYAFNSNYAPWYSYKQNIKNVIICEGITSIGWFAFDNCKCVKSVTIPESVLSIGQYAFYGCGDLREITIPASVKNIDQYAFYECENLENVNIDYGLTSIGNSAFGCCYSLRNIDLNNTLQSIGYGAFYNCYKLKKINIPDSVNNIGGCISNYCHEINVDYKNLYFTSDDGVLFNKNKTSLITYPAQKTEQSYTVPDSVVNIENSAFSNCKKLKSIALNDNLKNIGENAFNSCTALQNITIPDGIKSINDNTFRWCSSLKKVTIPDSITSIGECAFQSCQSITEITIPNSVTRIEHGAFNWCENLKCIVIPDSVTSLGDSVFSVCTNLKYVKFSKGLTEISYWTFSNCKNLNYVIIPESTNVIDCAAFSGCDNLKDVFYEGDENSWNNIIFEETGVSLDEENKNSWLNKLNIHYNTFENDYVVSEIIKETSCTENGEYVFVCPHGYTKQERIEALGHDNQIVEIVNPLDCNTNGYTVYECSRCGETYRDNYVYIDHNYESSVIESTCATNGYTKYHCTICGDSYNSDYVSALGHNFVDGVCLNCHMLEEDCIESEHPYQDNYDNTWTISKPNAKRIAITFSDETKTESCDYIYIYDSNDNQVGKYSGTQLAGKKISVKGDTVKIRLVTDSSVTYYGFALSDVKAYYEDCTHPETKLTNAITASCERTGYTGDTICSDCGEILENGSELPKTEHSNFYSTTIAPTCVEKGYTVKYCGECDEEIERFDYVDATGNHNFENGFCKVCGLRDSNYTIPSIIVGRSQTVTINTEGEKCYFEFIPDSNGTLTFYSSSDYDTYGYLYDFEMNKLSSNDDGGEGCNFRIQYDLTKGKTYYLACCFLDDEDTGSFDVIAEFERAEHNHDYKSKVTAPTCTEKGYTTHYCDCGENYIDSYVDALGHKSTTATTKATLSKDGKSVTKCTVCGAVTSTKTIAYPKTIKLSATSYTYDGKVKTPVVTVKDSNGKTLVKNTDYTVSYASGRKNVGKYSVKITFKGNYSGTKTLYFTIKPKATSISKLTASKKAFTVKWKKQATPTTGYEIQYATNSKFSKAKTVTVAKNSTTSKKISKLSGKKKYYVRVRTYKTVKVNGKSTKIYSSWSKAKTVTTKK